MYQLLLQRIPFQEHLLRKRAVRLSLPYFQSRARIETCSLQKRQKILTFNRIRFWGFT